MNLIILFLGFLSFCFFLFFFSKRSDRDSDFFSFRILVNFAHFEVHILKKRVFLVRYAIQFETWFGFILSKFGIFKPFVISFINSK